VDKSPEYPPTLIFTGATAALKGSALCASFAAGKFAMRALSQSLAREFGPKGIHVNHAIIDGVIDIERTKHYNLPGPDAKIKPEDVSLEACYLALECRLDCANDHLNHRSPTLTGTYTLSLGHASQTKSISDPTSRNGKQDPGHITIISRSKILLESIMSF
jgi:hypothetical protein